MKKTLQFNSWVEPSQDNPDITVTSQKTITFENDGQFTRNSLTDNVVPQNEEQFMKIINVYLSMDSVSEITE